ncbi:MAG: helix-turn-helix transcriptional regulator [Lachnospiraceae bacterium]|nr:helix-turn-helix transcriptional regulator [Lachnospiraceae bacterium]
MYNSQNIAKRIKSRAKQQGKPLGEMLSSCELGINTISKMAKGNDILTQNFAKIADYLDCSVDYLLGRTDNPEINK